MPFCAYCGNEVAEVSSTPCPKCGNPANGAPRGAPAPPTVPSSSGSKTAMVVVLILGGGFVLIAIIGIVAAIAIPNLVTAQHRAKQMRTMADIRSMSAAIEAYATDHNRYPDASNVSALESALVPKYIGALPRIDGWTQPIRYETWSTEDQPHNYAFASAGKGGIFELESLRDYEQGTTTKFDCDIVFANGKFVRYPQGFRK